jgi:hypothetical protein
MNGNNGQLVLPDGTTLTITETSQGVMSFTVSGGPTGTFTGTIFVKGGPNALGPGNACVFNGVTAGTCTANANPKNGLLFGVSHVDACPGVFVQPGPQPGAGGGDTSGRERREQREQREQQRKKAAGDPGGFDPVAAAAVAAPEGLPVTGLPVIWLVLVAGGLVASGLTLRRTT